MFLVGLWYGFGMVFVCCWAGFGMVLVCFFCMLLVCLLHVSNKVWCVVVVWLWYGCCGGPGLMPGQWFWVVLICFGGP